MAKRTGAVRTQRQHAKLTGKQRDTYRKTLEARRYMRDGFSLNRAAGLAGTTPRTVKRYAGTDLRIIGGRVHIGRDRAYRPMLLVTNTGGVIVNAGRRDASTIGGY